MAKVTYRAPLGDEAVVTTGGIRFFDGQAQEVDGSEYGHLLGKLSNNPHFEVDGHVAADDDTIEVDEPVIGLRAIHNGGGRFIIVRGDKDQKVRDGLTKTDAAAFNAMSEQDKEDYVA